MALTKNERRALELAREKIANGNYRRICFAIASVTEDFKAFDRLTTYIHGALGAQYLDRWQELKGFGERDENQRRADRLAWIDWMLGKPLAGEIVKLEWRDLNPDQMEAEYCGRFFYAFRIRYSANEWRVNELSGPLSWGENAKVLREVACGIKRDACDSAIVAHVWPALPPDEPVHV